MLRPVLLKVFYYYHLLATTACIFLFGATINYIFNGPSGLKLAWFNESDQVVAIFWALLTLHQLLGLFTIIKLKRAPYYWERLSFIVLCSIQFFFFMIPSFFFIASAIFLSSGNVG